MSNHFHLTMMLISNFLAKPQGYCAGVDSSGVWNNLQPTHGSSQLDSSRRYPTYLCHNLSLLCIRLPLLTLQKIARGTQAWFQRRISGTRRPASIKSVITFKSLKWR